MPCTRAARATSASRIPATTTSAPARALLKEFGDTPAPENVGLSPFGESVVRRANALGMIVDVSHASDACVRDVLRLSAAPIIASHSSARALTNHARNLSDELMRAIAAKGGVVHIVAYTGFLKLDPARDAAVKALESEVARQAGDAEFDSAKHEYLPAYIQGLERLDAQYPLATLDDYLDHIQHAVNVAGIDHVGLASDFDGGGNIQGWSDASQTRNVTAGLRRRGFTDAQIGAALERQPVARLARCRTGGANRDSRPKKQTFDAIFDAVMAEYHLPGMALGVVEDGKVIYTRTAGELVAGGGQADRCGHAVQDRVEHQGDDHRPARAPGGCRQAPVGRPRRQVPAAVQDERSVDHARDARARPAHPQQRTARRRRRSHVVAGA